MQKSNFELTKCNHFDKIIGSIKKGAFVLLKYKVADIIFETNHIYNYTPILCKNYLYNGVEKAQVRFTITQKDLDFEREKSAGDIAIGNHHLESLALYRKLCDFFR